MKQMRTENYLYINQLNSDCIKCDELVKSRNRITWGYGNCKSNVMFIGEAPGRFGCDQTGIPFTQDRSGMLLQKMLNYIGLKNTDVYVTNIVKCCPPMNRTPSNIEITNCTEYIMKELDFVKPKLLVLMGQIPTKTFFPKVNSITFAWGLVQNYLEYQSIIVPHPAYICRKQALLGRYKDTFDKIGKMINE